MSNLSGSSFVLGSSDLAALKRAQNAHREPSKPPTEPDTFNSSTTASAGPSSWQSCQRGVEAPAASSRARNGKSWTADELLIIQETKERFAARLAADHAAVLHPDVDTPFMDVQDAMSRLLPYHIFLQPKNDLEWVINGGKGKQKAPPEVELSETRFAIECYKRRKALKDKLRKIKIREGTRSAPLDQAYALAQAVLDSERTETAWLNAELRTARGELDKIERERRAANPPAPRTSYYNSPAIPSATLQSQWYRPYPYAYSQPYTTVSTPMNITYTTPVTSAAFATPAPTPAAASIPVQLPVSSLPALHALGITPVPAASLTAGQALPPAVLRSSAANGTMLNLEINVASLKGAQINGLAVILNSLMTRGTSTQPSVTPTAAPLSATPANGTTSNG
ncbi:GLTSCR protein conserved domain-containing protein [Pleurotus pulmonarius]